MVKDCTNCEYRDEENAISGHCGACQGSNFNGWIPMSKVKCHKLLCQDLNDIYARKNADYGDSFGKTFEEEGFAMSRIRLSDKLNRFKTLSKGEEQKVDDESIRDTLLDLANYAIMTVLEMDIRSEEDGK